MQAALAPLFLNRILCNGDEARLRVLLGVVPFAKLERPGVPCLCVATENGHLGCVKILVAHGANVEQVRFQGLTLLHLAAIHGHADLVQYLLTAAPSLLPERSRKGLTALHVALREGAADAVALLLEAGADLEGAMAHAATARVCEMLLAAGVKPTHTALAAVLGRGVLDVALVLFDRLSAAERDEFLKQLVSLDVCHQHVDSLPLWLARAENLTSFRVIAGNPLRSIPRNVVAQGEQGVLQYLRDIGTPGNKEGE